MLQAIQIKLYGFFRGHERSVKAKKNIFSLLFIKGAAALISMILLPLTIHYINAVQYGIWLTITSLIAWTTFFDIGLGNGLKNKLAAAIAAGDFYKAKCYVSTTYAIMVIVAAILFFLFLTLNPLISWEKVLNVNSGTGINFQLLASLLFGFFCLQFVAQILTVVLEANQQSGKAAYLNLTGQVFTVILIIGLILLAKPSLIYLSVIMAGSPIIVLIFASFVFYNKSYKAVAPRYDHVKLKYASSLLTAGSAFFIIQIGALVLFETDNIVITQLFGPAQVTVFNIAYKLFSLVLILFTIVITPFWSAFTEAYFKQDMQWIKKILKKLNLLWLGLSCLTTVVLLLSPYIFSYWFSRTVTVQFRVSAAMALYTIAFMWMTVRVSFLNGIGKIRLQLYLVLFSAIINIPLALWLGRVMGLAGVTLSNAVLLIIMGLAFSVQVNKLVNKTASGILNA